MNEWWIGWLDAFHNLNAMDTLDHCLLNDSRRLDMKDLPNEAVSHHGI
jgi:hypothetical protein